ncbi:hypothetical protein BH09BAC6_BH09BAC6_27610 [soil metagenome]|jgi:hypothetical protein
MPALNRMGKLKEINLRNEIWKNEDQLLFTNISLAIIIGTLIYFFSM